MPAATKLYDLAVKTGSYIDRATGAEKGRYQNVGSILQLADGSKMILLSRTFNPAGVPFKDGSDQIIISMFKPKEDNGSADPPAPPASNTHNAYKAMKDGRAAPTSMQHAPATSGFDDDIPF